MGKRKNPRVRKTNTKNWGQRGESKAIPSTVLIPSGRCPFIVESVAERDLKEWIVHVTNRKPGVVTYDKTVYTYWLRHSFDINSQEYREAKDVLERILPERIKNIDDLGFTL